MPNVAKELNETIGEFRNKKSDGRLVALAVVVAVFLVSATAAAVFNHEGNAGAKVAEAASRVDRQGDDTQAVCTDIRELILEQKNLAAVSPDSYANESTSGNNSEFKYASPNDSSNVAMPKNGGANDAVDNVSNERRNSIYGINPANGGASNAPESADEKDDQDAAGDADQIVPAHAHVQRPGTRNPGRPGADPAPGSHGPDSQQLDAAVRSRQAGTPGTGGANQRHPPAMVRAPGRTDHPHRTAGQRQAGRHHASIFSLIDDTKADDRWRRQASDVEMRSAQALSKIGDLNTFILFYKNQSDCKAITEYDDLDVSLQVGVLLESLDAFEAETAGRAEAMQSS